MVDSEEPRCKETSRVEQASGLVFIRMYVALALAHAFAPPFSDWFIV